jgi:hypothetical protein
MAAYDDRSISAANLSIPAVSSTKLVSASSKLNTFLHGTRFNEQRTVSQRYESIPAITPLVNLKKPEKWGWLSS